MTKLNKIVSYFFIVIGSVGMLTISFKYWKHLFSPKCFYTELYSWVCQFPYIGPSMAPPYFETIPYVYAWKKHEKLYISLFIWNNFYKGKSFKLKKITHIRYKKFKVNPFLVVINQYKRSLLKITFKLDTVSNFFIAEFPKNKIKIFVPDIKFFKCFRRRIINAGLKENSYYFSLFPMSIAGGRINKLVVDSEDTIKIVLYFPNPWVYSKEHKYYRKCLFYDKNDTSKFYLIKDSLKKDLLERPKKEIFAFEFKIKNEKLLFPNNTYITKEKRGSYRIRIEFPTYKNYDSLYFLYVALQTFNSPYDSIIFEDLDSKSITKQKKIYIYYKKNIETIQNINVPTDFNEYIKEKNPLSFYSYYVFNKSIEFVSKPGILFYFIILMIGIFLLKFKKTKGG